MTWRNDYRAICGTVEEIAEKLMALEAEGHSLFIVGGPVWHSNRGGESQYRQLVGVWREFPDDETEVPA